MTRFFINIIKPTSDQLRRKNPSTLIRIRIAFYRFLLKCLSKTYSHYAICDTIILSDLNIETVYQYRDVEFEKELIKHNIKALLKPQVETFPFERQRSKRGIGFKYFNFRSTLTFTVDGKELVVKHDNLHTIKGSLKAKVKTTSTDSLLTRSIIELALTKRENHKKTQQNLFIKERSLEWQKTYKPNEIEKGNEGKYILPIQEKGSVFARERQVVTQVIDSITEDGINNIDTSINNNEEEIIKKKGFDIDTSF